MQIQQNDLVDFGPCIARIVSICNDDLKIEISGINSTDYTVDQARESLTKHGIIMDNVKILKNDLRIIINNSHPQLQPLHTNTIEYKTLQCLSIPWGAAYRYVPFVFKDNIMILSGDCLTAYDYINDKHNVNYDASFPDIVSHQVVFNPDDNILYSFRSPYHKMFEYNVATKKIIIDVTFPSETKQNYHYNKKYTEGMSNLYYHPMYGITCYVPYPFNVLHLIWSDHHRSYHMKYDPKTHQLCKLTSINLDWNRPFSESKMIYIESQRKLLLFGGIKGYYGHTAAHPKCSNKIYFTYINDKHQTKYEWYRSKVDLPHKHVAPMYYHVISAFDGLVFVFYFCTEQDKGIWCLNSFTEKWYRVKSLPFPFYTDNRLFDPQFVVKTNTNFIHFMKSNYYKKYHYKIKLNDIINDEVIAEYNRCLICLLGGFMRENTNIDHNNMHIAIDLIRIVLYFYSNYKPNNFTYNYELSVI
eukprot:223639_1